MRYTYTIEKAIRAAAVLHAGQVRKGPVPYPYITHLFAVAMIVADYTDEENTIAAALLSNTLSDTDYTPRELEDDFGGDIKDLVMSVTEYGNDATDRKAIVEQKRSFLRTLKNAKEDTFIILSASKIHTMRTIVEEYLEDIPAFVADFGPNQDEELFFYQEVNNALNRHMQSPILAEFNDVFTEYKNFIHAVNQKIEIY